MDNITLMAVIFTILAFAYILINLIPTYILFFIQN